MGKRIVYGVFVLFFLLGTEGMGKIGVCAAQCENNQVEEGALSEKADYTVISDKQTYYSEDGSFTMQYVDANEIHYEEKRKKDEETLDFRLSLETDNNAKEDFFNDCGTDYGFKQFDYEMKAVELEKLYISMLNLIENAYSDYTDISANDFGGQQYYCIGTVEYAELGLTSEEVFNVYISVLYDHPLVYYADNSIVYDGKAVYLMIKPSFAKGQTRRNLKNSIETAVKQFSELTGNANSNYDIIRIVHDAIIEEVSYAFEEDGVTPKNNDFVHEIAGYVSEEKIVVCDGYAKTLGTILNYLDIENIYVSGWAVPQGDVTSDSDAHAWNMVRLGDGNYYYVDATWDDAEGNVGTEYFCSGSAFYNDHSIQKNGESAASYYLYDLPQVAENVFTGEDSLVKAEDPDYIVINSIDYILEDGVLTFTGRGWIEQPEEYVNGEWFERKEEVTKLVFDEGISFIGNFTFRGFDKVEEISFPDSLMGIGQQAFDGCAALKEVTLPDYMTFYGAGMFANCTSLKTVTFGKLTKGYAMYADQFFTGSTQLATIIVPEENVIFTSVDNVLMNKDLTELIEYPSMKKTENYIIPEGICRIDDCAFNENDYLKTVCIPDTVEYIGTDAFSCCTELKSLTFPESVKAFYLSEENSGFSSVYGCTNLEFIDNQSQAVLPLVYESGINGGKDDTKYYMFWKNNDEYVSEISNGKVYPEYKGRALYEGEDFVMDKIKYTVTDSECGNINFNKIKENNDMGTVKIVELTDDLKTQLVEEVKNGRKEAYEIPETIEYLGWNYNVSRDLNIGNTNPQLSETSCVLRKNASQNLSVYWTSQLDYVTWSSSDTSVAIVQDGMVHALAEGTATISCRVRNVLDSEENSRVLTCMVTVTANDGVDTSSSDTPLLGTELQQGDSVSDVMTQGEYILLKTTGQSGEVQYVKCINNKAESVTIPDEINIQGKTYKVTSIAKNAFKNNKKLQKIIINSNIQEIGANAFRGCKNLKNITIKTTKLSKKSIGKNAFKGIAPKATVKVPKKKLKSYQKLLKSAGTGNKVKIKKI